MYAIINVKTGKFVYRTDFRYHPPHQRTSKNKMITYDDFRVASVDFKNRECGRDYAIALLKTIQIKKIVHPLSDPLGIERMNYAQKNL